MEKFKVEYKLCTSEWGDLEYAKLLIRLPYYCFGKKKYVYNEILRLNIDELVKLKICTKEETLNYMIYYFFLERDKSRCKKNLRKNLIR